MKEKYLKFLKENREYRKFNAKDYVDSKINIINDFFKKNNLNAVTLGISGGIDSTVVLYLFDKASKEPDSPIKKILPLSLPIYTPDVKVYKRNTVEKIPVVNQVKGVTGQSQSAYFAKLVIQGLDYDFHEINLEPAYSSIIKDSLLPQFDMEIWAEGQMASILRTPVLYYHAAILQTWGYKSIVAGTTNLSEYGIGFFGKASPDMTNDIQIIMDIYKSEVYQVAEYLGVPEQIINRKPTGDVYSGVSDVELMGIGSYDELELFLILRIWEGHSYDEEFINDFIESTSYQNLQKLYDTNKHKFQVGHPCHILNII